jgi:hypothetical protein
LPWTLPLPACLARAVRAVTTSAIVSGVSCPAGRLARRRFVVRAAASFSATEP